MWKRFVHTLRCPCCYGELGLVSIKEQKVKLNYEDYQKGEKLGIASSKLDEYVESGMLLCSNCKYWFPILSGLPVLIPYETSIFQEFLEKNKGAIADFAKGFTTPKKAPNPGEGFVLRSFSREWLEYKYDGVIWGWSYEDRENTFLAEMGLARGEVKKVKFLEVGCGLGVTTLFAEKNYYLDAVGIDLSLAVFKAAKFFKHNPFLHFVQATLFQLPFKKNCFDLVYSHGVLHHTYSTRKAFRAIVPYCKPGGLTYIWVYGRAGQTNSWDRKLGHYAEVLIRPFLSRAPTTLATACLTPIALGYIIMNAILRINNPTLQAYNLKRALHAARDRFTPRYAYRHDYLEVEGWFKENGFEDIQKLDWRLVSPAVRAQFRGSIGVRGRRKVSR